MNTYSYILTEHYVQKSGEYLAAVLSKLLYKKLEKIETEHIVKMFKGWYIFRTDCSLFRAIGVGDACSLYSVQCGS